MVVDVSSGVPVIEYWGSRLEAIDGWIPSQPVPHGGLDRVVPAAVVPTEGFLGRPGIAGHRRGGRHWSPRWRYVEHRLVENRFFEHRLDVTARDEVAHLDLTTRLSLVDDVLSVEASLTNTGDGPYMLDALTLTIPMPDRAVRLGTYSGRWGAEFGWQHVDWPLGAWTVENRTGRTSHEHPPYLWLTSADADEWTGEVWGVHLAWSGNHSILAERLVDGRRYVQLGELFHPGEMCVYPGETHTTPAVIGVRSDHGFTPASWAFHREARRRVPHRPSTRRVHVNTWEAVYFDHDVERLKRLAEAAADVGIERFVLDDGWFGGRRHDRAGLGDWTVSTEVYPNGLSPLVDHVRSLGMDFGIWVEPEMVNPDSDLLRAHPDWALVTEGYEPALGRHQLVLDLTRSAAFDHVLARLDDLLTDHDIAYVKWDMNRWVVQGSGADGKAAAHDQTMALYRLLDELRRRHPDVEFESCASGGGRIDHEILRRVERFWTSDNNDALERSVIHHRASMVMPPEVLGSHVGPSPAHNTGRRLPMALRTAVAMFGHMGVEADVTRLDETDRSILRHGIELHKTWRDFLRSGRFVRFDRGDRAVSFGVQSDDASELLVCHVQIDSSSASTTNWRFPNLDPRRSYRIRNVPLVPTAPNGSAAISTARRQPEWWDAASSDDAPIVSGGVLRTIGLAAPTLPPQRAVVLHLSAS